MFLGLIQWFHVFLETEMMGWVKVRYGSNEETCSSTFEISMCPRSLFVFFVNKMTLVCTV